MMLAELPQEMDLFFTRYKPVLTRTEVFEDMAYNNGLLAGILQGNFSGEDRNKAIYWRAKANLEYFKSGYIENNELKKLYKDAIKQYEPK